MTLCPALKSLEQTLKCIFEDKASLREFLAIKGQPAQTWLDQMQQLVDSPDISSEMRSSVLTAILRLSKKSGLHPQCLAVQNVKKFGKYPMNSGAFGEVWKGVIGDSKQHVCLKVVKIYYDSDIEQLSRQYLREAILWRQMKHPNVLPFLGIYQLEHDRQLCLISPWMERGNLLQYLKKTPREDIDHYTLAHDVAAGLCYLHLQKIVHSDLKGVNVLVTDALRACICDFGLSRVADTRGLKITSTDSRSGGTGRWLAPELLVDGGVVSRETDVYAYGCVCFEIFTGQHPFPELPNEAAVVLAVSSRKRPSRPLKGIPQLTDAMWALMESCWDATPAFRPTAGQVVNEIIRMDTSRSFTTAPQWNESIFTQIWGNVDYPPPPAPSHNPVYNASGFDLLSFMARAPATGSNLCGDTPFLIPSAAPKDLNLCNSQGFKNPAKPITPSQLTSIGINSSASPTNADSSSSLGLPVYSASGFDLFSVMARVATRPEPKLVLGPVDFMGSFVVSDARRYDCPVIYVSPTFCRLTGYDESEVIGRNCRFLQSPNGDQARGQVRQYTSHEAVKHLKRNLVADKECQTSIVNYKKNGDAFINLVTVIPIRGDELGASGDEDKVVYHVGYQVDLTEHPNAILQKLEDGSYIVNYTSNNPVAVKPMNPLNRLFQQQQHHRGLRGIGAGSVALGLGRGGGMAAGVGGLVGVGGYGLGMSAEDRKFNAIGAPVVSPEMKKYLEEPEFLKSFPVTTGVNADAMLAGSTNHLLSLILLEYAPDFLHVVSLIGDFLYVAPSVRRVLGYESYELVGRSLVDICHPSDKVPLMRELIESSSVNLSAGASHAGGSTGEEGEDIVPNPASDPASDILLMRPRTVDLIFRALTKGKRYVWVECRGRLYQEPGKGRKAILLSGRAKEMTGLKWETVKSASGGVRGTEVGVRSVTESPKAVGKDTNGRKRKKAGVEESPAQSPPDKTPEQVDVKSEFWGTITRSGIMLVVTSGVRDVLGYEETDLMGRHVDMITDDKIFLEEVAKVGGTGGMSGVRRTTCRMFRKGYEVGPEEATVEVEVILYPAFVDDTVHNSEQTISQTNVIYQIRRRAGGTEPDVMHLMDEDVFLPLDTNRGSSWQYELQQLRFANDRLKEQIKELEGEMDRKASISSASDSLGGGGLVVANAQRYGTTSNHMLPGVAVYDRRPQPSYEPRASSPWAYHFESVPGLVPVSIPARYQKPERDSTVADEVL